MHSQVHGIVKLRFARLCMALCCDKISFVVQVYLGKVLSQFIELEMDLEGPAIGKHYLYWIYLK